MARRREDADPTDLPRWYGHVPRIKSVPSSLTPHAAGIAAAYAAWIPNLSCSSSNGDEEGVCELVNTYTLIGTWIIPVLRE